MPPPAPSRAVQASFDDLGVPLREVTFVVLDLETTGLDPQRDRITEVGAVKVRGGEILGELQCLVAPGVPIPPAISALTGITPNLVRDRPPIEAVLPMVLEFLRGAVFVGHNANFDVSFLRAAVARHDYPPLDMVVVDTARLARRALREDEIRDVRLSTLSRHFRTNIRPEHRALPDARATMEVLHGLLERVGSLGVHTLEDLRDYTSSRSDPAFRKVGLVAGAPEAPGVYRFVDARGTVLYVGKATNLRLRLRQYFGQDPRRKIADLVRQTAAVRWELAPTELEASVREVRAIHQHRPRFNSRSRHPERAVFVKLTHERFPRLSIVTDVRDPRCLHLGPLLSRRVAEAFVDAVHEALPLRQCTARLSPTKLRPACVLKDIGRCGAPCDGSQDAAAYGAVVERFRHSVTDDPGELLGTLRAAMESRAARGQYEHALRQRRRLHHAATVLGTSRTTGALVGAERLVAISRDVDGNHEMVLVQRGRLAATEKVDAGADVDEVERRLHAIAPAVPPPGPPSPEELEELMLVARWLARPGVRIVSVVGEYAEPWTGGAAVAHALVEARRVARAVRRDLQVATGTKVARRGARVDTAAVA